MKINEIHDRIKPLYNSDDYFCDLPEEKLIEFEKEMKILGVNYTYLEELPIILNSPFK